MKLIKYIYNNSAKPICRDAADKFADSLGFVKYPVVDETSLVSINPRDNIIIEIGWLTENYVKAIYRLVNRLGINPIYRRVDDNPIVYTNLDLEIRDLVIRTGHRVIRPYKKKIFDYYPTIHIPYHYDTLSEKSITEDRNKDIVLSGDCDKYSYPLRYELLNHELPFYDIIKHPGYDPVNWNHTNLSEKFLDELGNYKFMILDSGDRSEILKYLECAEAGCVPIGNFPEYYSSISDYQKANNYDSLKSSYLKLKDHWMFLAQIYRDEIKVNRSKERILHKYYELFK